ncbi:sigma-70 family RNA polymerase sigma factor [Deltaproteobacteria bacterium TL4]
MSIKANHRNRKTPSIHESNHTHPVRFLERHFNDIEKVIKNIASRHHMNQEEVEEFTSEVHVKLVENDYAIIRSFNGKSAFKTYLFTIFGRFFVDFLRSRKGRWRPSRESLKIGPVAVKLEELVYKERHSYEEAYRILIINYQFQINIADFQKLVSTLKRTPPIRGEEQASVAVSVDDADPEFVFTHSQFQSKMEKLYHLMGIMVQDIEKEEERFILKMRFESGYSITQIALLLGKNRSHINFLLNALLKRFRTEILSSGITLEDAKEVLLAS